MSQRGVTLVELMVVLAILGVLLAAGVGFARTDPGAGDVARGLAGMLRETARQAVSGGPVRGDVVAAFGVKARARVRVYTSGGVQGVVIERLQEAPLPSADFSWVTVYHRRLGRGATLHGWRASAELEGGTGPEFALGDGQMSLHCFTDGSCEAMTLYLRDRDGGRHTRLVTMPLGAAPLVLDRW